jgi:glyoxylase-like metal-dependent hydrolase (beta-lactamase superfamily II)
LLDALDGQRPRAILLTHIHLDHAGARGTLARQWPDVEVYVHERGARHMADPTKLLASAERLYGEDMERLWGRFEAVPRERLHLLEGGERIEVAGEGFEVAYTPGHASHHVAYRHDATGTAFVGDVGGVRITPEAPAIPPTPPPDIDLEAWHRSLQTIAAWEPVRLAFTHFGAADDVAAQIEQLARRLDAWAAVVREGDEEDYEQAVRRDLAGVAPDSPTFESYMQAVPLEQSYAGLRRYWDKYAQRNAGG